MGNWHDMHFLVTGASGKVGRRVVKRLLAEFPDAPIRAMVHSRDLDLADHRIEVVRGNIAEQTFVDAAMQDITHVVHMATCKELPEIVMDVVVKGMFWLLEAFRANQGRYFILVGGDAAIGHFNYPVDAPVTEATPHRASPGCYGLSKVLEEVMLSQAHIQYGIEGCCLRAPWIMADDDLRYALSFGQDVFGAPRWCDVVGAAKADGYAASQIVPRAIAIDGKPLRRGMVSVDEVVEAIIKGIRIQPTGCQTFNIAMDQPFDYDRAAAHLRTHYGQSSIDVETQLHSVAMSNSRAREVLGWSPRYDTESLIDAAWAYQPKAKRQPVVYPG